MSSEVAKALLSTARGEVVDLIRYAIQVSLCC